MSDERLPELDEIESLAASVIRGPERNRYWREHVTLVAKDANILCLEVRRLQKEALLRDADAAAMRAELTQHEYCDCTHVIGGACQGCCHQETDDAPHAADCPWKAALDGSAGEKLAREHAELQEWAEEVIACQHNCDHNEPHELPAWLAQAADGDGK